MPAVPVLELEGVRHRWPRQRAELSVANFCMRRGERVFLCGPSGSGKSTLLNLIAGTLSPQAGRVRMDGTDLASLSAARRDRLRADRIGVVFQQFNLLPFLDVLGNVVLPCRFSAIRQEAATAAHGTPLRAAHALLDALGLHEQAAACATVAELSVGQQQRVALARALIGSPPLLLADEPTSALDAATRDAFMDLLLRESRHTGAAILFVSHDEGLARHFDRTVPMETLARDVAA